MRLSTVAGGRSSDSIRASRGAFSHTSSTDGVFPVATTIFFIPPSAAERERENAAVRCDDTTDKRTVHAITFTIACDLCLSREVATENKHGRVYPFHTVAIAPPPTSKITEKNLLTVHHGEKMY